VDFCVSKSKFADEEICDLTIANSNTIFTYPIQPLEIEYVLLELRWIVCNQICDDNYISDPTHWDQIMYVFLNWIVVLVKAILLMRRFVI
jgi:hypothetical protein